MAISIPGIGSNLDVDSIVSQLMRLEQRPLVTLAQREAEYTSQLSTLAKIKGALAGFQTAASSLKSAGSSTTFKFTSSDTSAINGSAGATAGAGTYAVSVTQLAQAQHLVAVGQSSVTAKIGDGSLTTLTFSFGSISGGSFDSVTGKYSGAAFAADAARTPVQVKIDASNNTLEGIRDAVNAANAGVTAAIVNDGSGTPYRLTISANQSGENSSLKIAATGNAAVSALLAHDPAAVQNLSQTQAALDAQLTVNGIAATRRTNTVTEVIEGVTLTLSKTATNVTVTVASDISPVRSALESLVKAYNDANKTIADATAYQAVLQGDSTAVGIQGRMRAALGRVRNGLDGQIKTLSQLGVSFQKDGALAFDAAKLQSVIDSDRSGVKAAALAFGTALSDLADQLVGSNSTVQARTDGINRSIADIGRRRDSIESRLEAIEKRYRAQFSALDSMLSSMQQTSDFLTQQLANLPKISND